MASNEISDYKEKIEWIISKIRTGTEEDLLEKREHRHRKGIIKIDVFTMAVVLDDRVLASRIMDLILNIKKTNSQNKLPKIEDYIFFACKYSVDSRMLSDVLQRFNENIQTAFPLHKCIMQERLDLFEDLLNNLKFYGIDVNQQDEHGMTPLHWCADTGKRYYFMLVSKKKTLNLNEMILNNHGKTPAETVLRRSDVFFDEILEKRIHEIPNIVTKRVYDYLTDNKNWRFAGYKFPPYPEELVQTTQESEHQSD